MKFLKLNLMSVMIITIVVLSSCNQDKNELLSQPLEKEQNIITDYLLELGYEKDRIYFEESNVLFSACEHHQYKQTVAEMLSIIEETQKQDTELEIGSNEVDSRSHVFKYRQLFPSIETVENLVFQIDPGVSDEWRTAIYQGIHIMNTLSIVNGVSRCAVSYREETNLNNSYNIKFIETELGFTSGGAMIGGQTNFVSGIRSVPIKLRKVSENEFDLNTRVRVVVHEIFHTLGFQHTGDATIAILVGGTGFNDQHSIMGNNNAIKPSVHDIKAMKKLYPTWLRKPNLLYAKRSNAGKDVSFSYNNDAANHPYFWIKAESYTLGKQQLTVKWYKVNDLTSKQENLIMKDVPANAKYLRVRAYNYKKDRYSNWSKYDQI